MRFTHTRLLVEIVRDSAGGWDTRNLDVECLRRGYPVEQGLIVHLRDLARQGLVVALEIEGGTGPGWRLTARGTPNSKPGATWLRPALRPRLLPSRKPRKDCLDGNYT